MYLNVISFKNSKTLAFQTETPYSIDKVNSDWNLVTDANNGQALSFRGSEIVTIASAVVTETTPVKEEKKPKRKPKVVTGVVKE